MAPQIVTALLQQGAVVKKTARGHSMFPFIRDRDHLLMAIPQTHLRLGDIVVFQHPKFGGLAIHRIIGKRGNMFLIKGDNSKCPDGWLPKDKILAHIVSAERNSDLLRPRLRIESAFIAFLSRAGLLIPLRKKIRMHMPRLVPFFYRLF
mgnify:CR=1 FL=1